MNDQLALFTAPVPAKADHDVPGISRERDPDWPHATWRFGSGRGIEYRHPEPTPPPAAVLGGAWQWNPLVPGWRLDYPRPPFSLAPKGVASDRHGPKLLPPPGFLEIDLAAGRGQWYAVDERGVTRERAVSLAIDFP